MVGKNLEREWPLLFAVLQFNDRAGSFQRQGGMLDPLEKLSNRPGPSSLLPSPVDGTPPPQKVGQRTAEQNGRTCRGIRCQLSALTVAQQRIVDTWLGGILVLIHWVHYGRKFSMFELFNVQDFLLSTVMVSYCPFDKYDTAPTPITTKRRALCV